MSPVLWCRTLDHLTAKEKVISTSIKTYILSLPKSSHESQVSSYLEAFPKLKREKKRPRERQIEKEKRKT